NNLAGLYRDGVGVGRDINEALKWYRLAAERGERTSYSNLMHVYADGRDLPPNYGEAYRWALLAVQNPSPFSRPISKEFIDSLSSRLLAEDRSRIETETQNWIHEHPAGPDSLKPLSLQI